MFSVQRQQLMTSEQQWKFRVNLPRGLRLVNAANRGTPLATGACRGDLAGMPTFWRRAASSQSHKHCRVNHTPKFLPKRLLVTRTTASNLTSSIAIGRKELTRHLGFHSGVQPSPPIDGFSRLIPCCCYAVPPLYSGWGVLY
jgi:hypothetical protein